MNNDNKGRKRGRRRRGFHTTSMVSLAVVGLLLASCGDDGTSSDEPSTSTDVSSTEEGTDTSAGQATETTTPSTTAESTLAPGPPVFDPPTLGDNMEMPSFVLTVTVGNTNFGQLTESITTTGYIKDPNSVYQLASFSSGDTPVTLREYLVGGRSYQQDGSGSWYLWEAGNPASRDYADDLDLRYGTLSGVVTATLAGQEDFAGVPANHFVFDETDLAYYSSYTPDRPSPEVEGDFYLAQDGNYILSTHSKETSPDRTYEVTEAVSFVGQVPEIVLPPDFEPMRQALDVGVDLAGLLPPGAELRSMVRYGGGIGVDYYRYQTSVDTNDELLNFYRTLAPTNGWTVSYIGFITPHYEPINCELDFECVILNNGGDQIVISFDGTISIEFDREHIFTPL